MSNEFHPRINRVIRLLAVTCFILLSTIRTDLVAQRESAYSLRQSEEAPQWVTEMYKVDADPGIVLKLYDEYYKTHPFVKNQHTQYLKRWISGLNKRSYPIRKLIPFISNVILRLNINAMQPIGLPLDPLTGITLRHPGVMHQDLHMYTL